MPEAAPAGRSRLASQPEPGGAASINGPWLGAVVFETSYTNSAPIRRETIDRRVQVASIESFAKATAELPYRTMAVVFLRFPPPSRWHRFST